ncbi:hypothetical protein [Snuella sedimenti]|uniref:hypothetical protein n=1 Tax=Snuella sedimenti TaxID=2798802 RepID=UPI001E56F951|nr:hypothetical protein [Snuella sedimenti]
MYHWFGLEPVGDERTSLTFSVFIPADGTNSLYYYDHAAKKQGYAGVSAMPLKVIESRKEFDWSVNKPVEFRPYIKNIAGRKRMFFLGTISAIRDDSDNFDGSATPDLALIDSEYRDVVWIDVKHPSNWDKTVYDQLNEAWRASEGIDHYYIETTKHIDLVTQKSDSIQALTETDERTKAIERLQRQLDSLKANKFQKRILNSL